MNLLGILPKALADCPLRRFAVAATVRLTGVHGFFDIAGEDSCVDCQHKCKLDSLGGFSRDGRATVGFVGEGSLAVEVGIAGVVTTDLGPVHKHFLQRVSQTLI